MEMVYSEDEIVPVMSTLGCVDFPVLPSVVHSDARYDRNVDR